MAGTWAKIRANLNFFRVHVLFFTFTPLIFSAVFYGANGQFHIAYIDALFNCVSAMTVCGLASVDLSSLTGFQQALLFVQQCLGNPVIVSWVMVYIRRYYFAMKFQHFIEAELAKRKAAVEENRGQGDNWGRKLTRIFSRQPTLTTVPEGVESRAHSSLKNTTNGFPPKDNEDDEKASFARTKSGVPKRPPFSIFRKATLQRLRTDMIRRVDNEAPKPIDPNGLITDDATRANASATSQMRLRTLNEIKMERRASPSPIRSSDQNGKPEIQSPNDTVIGEAALKSESRIAEHNESRPSSSIIEESSEQFSEQNHVSLPISQPTRSGVPLGHSLTVDFRTPDMPRDRDNVRSGDRWPSRRMSFAGGAEETSRRPPLTPGGVPIANREPTMATYRSRHTYASAYPHDVEAKRTDLHKGFGGFPLPHTLLFRGIRAIFPNFGEKFVRTVTMPRTQTLQSAAVNGLGGDGIDRPGRSVPYISFDVLVGRNSKFHVLTDEQMEELGGVEYRALTALLWIVGTYHLAVQLIAFIIIAPYISTHRWRNVFEVPKQHRFIPPVWFAAFQVVSAYTNTGMSLVDQSMVPFQHAYPMLFAMAFLILAGNTAYPCFLRLFIWIITKCIHKQSRLNETLHFLLDHPRRCFVYLFPSHQTWFLVTVLVVLNGTDWFFFLVLDIGNQALNNITWGTRVIIGLLQATAVRAAGFGTVPLSVLAPAVQALYVMMMYISVYPIAMSVRSTNVYEERSLGVFDEEDGEDEPDTEGSRVAVWGRYLAWHARKQLAFDMWWLGLALFLVCIIERDQIVNENNLSWLTIFTILFELVSAYGTVGLSLGVPFANYSLSGAFSPLSKLIVCAVMLRGRHRGLPVAIDRAVILPLEFKRQSPGEEDVVQEEEEDDDETHEARSRSRSRRGTFSSKANIFRRRRPSTTRTDASDLSDTEERPRTRRGITLRNFASHATA